MRPPIFSDRALEAGGVKSPDAAFRSWNDLNVPRDALARNRLSVLIVPKLYRSSLLELRVALDELLGTPSGKAYRNAPIFVIAFDAHDGADAVTGMPHPSP